MVSESNGIVLDCEGYGVRPVPPRASSISRSPIDSKGNTCR
jgi:hypothetical protein